MRSIDFDYPVFFFMTGFLGFILKIICVAYCRNLLFFAVRNECRYISNIMKGPITISKITLILEIQSVGHPMLAAQ